MTKSRQGQAEHPHAPRKGLLFSYRNRRPPWKTMLGEVIDNSLDAGATEIHIVLGTRHIEIIDNGSGCQDTDPMFVLGDHEPSENTRSGRYGIGLKDAVISLWGQTRVATSDGEHIRVRVVDWDIYAKSNNWGLPKEYLHRATDKFIEQERLLGRTGTRIVCTDTQRPIPGEKEIANWKRDVDFYFGPALSRGVNITISDTRGGSKRWPCEAYKMPPRESVVRQDAVIAGRYHVSLDAGIVKDGMFNPHPGFSYHHAHRVLKKSNANVENLSLDRIAGVVVLSDDWPVTTNKDDVSHYSDELAEFIQRTCASLLKEGDQRAREIHSSAIESRLSEMFSDLVSNLQAKERRDPKENGEKGTVEAKNTGRKRNAKKTQKGRGTAKQRAFQRRWNVTLESFGDHDCVAGRVMPESNTIRLNTDLAAIRAAEEEKNVRALFFQAMNLLAWHIATADEHDDLQQNFRFDADGEFERNDALSILTQLIEGSSELSGSASGEKAA